MFKSNFYNTMYFNNILSQFLLVEEFQVLKENHFFLPLFLFLRNHYLCSDEGRNGLSCIKTPFL
jgi:hypothetical protein